MPFFHKLILYITLGFLCLSLMLPGLWEVLRSTPNQSGLVAQHVDALHQLRAYNGMVAAVGFISGITIFNLERNRDLIIVLAMIMLFLATSRTISLFFDGVPGLLTLVYILTEILIAMILFVFLPPNKPGFISDRES